LSVPARVLFRDLDGEAVLLDLTSGRYFGLNEVGTRIWNLVVAHGDAEPAWRALSEEYEAPGERLYEDVLRFLDLLITQGLLERDAA
jgi:hypothetical protein